MTSIHFVFLLFCFSFLIFYPIYIVKCIRSIIQVFALFAVLDLLASSMVSHSLLVPCSLKIFNLPFALISSSFCKSASKMAFCFSHLAPILPSLHFPPYQLTLAHEDSHQTNTALPLRADSPLKNVLPVHTRDNLLAPDIQSHSALPFYS